MPVVPGKIQKNKQNKKIWGVFNSLMFCFATFGLFLELITTQVSI